MKKRKLKFFGLPGITVVLLIIALITCATMAYAEDVQPEESAEEISADESIPAEDRIIIIDTDEIPAEPASPSDSRTEEPDIEYIENDLELASDSETASPSESENDEPKEGEDEVEDAEISFTDSDMIVLPELERDGYAFVEWNTREDGSGRSFKAGEEYKILQDSNLYAIWKKIENTEADKESDVSLEPEGAVESEPAAETVVEIYTEPENEVNET